MLIVHRCTTCGHPDYWHDWHDDGGRKKTAGNKVDGKQVAASDRRGCCRRSASWGPSQVAPRWSTVTFERIAEVLPPGGLAAGVTAADGSTSCDCDECWALWKQTTGQTRKPRHLAAVPSGA